MRRDHVGSGRPSGLRGLAAITGIAAAAALVGTALLSSLTAAQAPGQTPPPPAPGPAVPVVYEGARLILGDGGAPIENGAFVVRNGRIAAIGQKGAVPVPAGAQHVDLSGKTVMPALVNTHIHFGYERFTKATGEALPGNFTPQNLEDHLLREAAYGVGTVNDGGSAPIPLSLQFQIDQTARNFPPAARSWFNAGIVPPNGGPDATLIKGTRPLHANYEVLRAPEARAAVLDVAAKNITHIKLWIGDRNGTYPAMPHEVYDAVIDEAHKHNIRVHTHAGTLRDQKDIVRAGSDVLIHIVPNEKLDDEYIALLKAKKPYWVPIIGTGDRSEACDDDPFFTAALTARMLADIHATSCAPNANAATREAIIKANFATMVASGARVVLGDDEGIRPTFPFGAGAHHELQRYVEFGLTPAQAIVAGTSRAAEALGLADVGTLKTGLRADFLVLDANPLDDIRNTRRISRVYLRGAALDRDALLARWKRTSDLP